MYLGYNTNGFVHHRLSDTIAILSDLGYKGIAITIDHNAIDPFDSNRMANLEQLAFELEKYQMRSVIETGARYVLDPLRKHQPSLVSRDPQGRAKRLAFYEYAIDAAAILDSDCVSFWSGRLEKGADPKEAWNHLAEGVNIMADYAHQRGVVLGMETEPGMFVDKMCDFERLLGLCNRSELQLTMDVGHFLLQGDLPLSHFIHLWSSRLVNVHMEDMRADEHKHLPFGKGEIDFDALLEAFRQIGYEGGLYVELSGDSDTAPQTAANAYKYLSRLMK